MTFVIDASVTLAWAFPDEDSGRVRQILWRLHESSAIVPTIWLFEVPNSLLVAERRRRVTQEQTARFTEFLGGLPIEIDDSGLDFVFDRGLSLARIYGLSLYDTMYLDLALRLGLPLVTLDRRLLYAARVAGVPLLEEDVV